MQAQILWPKGPDQATRLDLKMLPGKWGKRYGRFYVEGDIPENVAVSAVGRPLKDLLSSSFTDPHDIRIMDVSPADDGIRILFEGAHLLRRCVPIFRDREIADKFAVEVAKLAYARTLLWDILSADNLPDQWWRDFEKLMVNGAVTPFAASCQNKRTKVWVPSDPVQALLKR